MKKIIIIGGGIGGLTVAHQLSKYNFDIELYEMKNKIGGMARSSRDNDGCATEYCWRVFFGFYDNLFKVLNEIKLINNPNKTPLDNMTIYKHLNFVDKKLTLYDYIKTYYIILYGLTSCDERLKQLDNLSWWEALKTTSDTSLFREIGEWLGMDRYNGSYNSVIKVGMEMQIIKSYLDKNYKDYITTLPTSEAIFDHWYEHLIKNNVKINLNHTLNNVFIKNNNIDYVVINGNKIKGDYYIFSIPVEQLNNIINKNNDLLKGDLININKLTNTCLHMQVSFQLYFNKSISIGKDKNAFLLVDSPWDLIILMYDKIYLETELCKNLPNVKGGWSVAVCTAYKNGLLFKKPFYECTYDEIKEEIWYQLINSKELTETIKNNNNFSLNKDLIVKWSPMWNSFYYDNQIKTLEPKFTNNKGSLNLRPSFKSPFNNMYISTAYIKETIDIFSMEAACIAGNNVSKDILLKENIDTNIKPTIRERPLLFLPFRLLDKLLFNLNIENYTLYIFILFLILLIVIIIKKY